MKQVEGSIAAAAVLLASMLLVTALLVAGCVSGAASGAASETASSQDSGETVQAAVVVYADGNDILLADRETKTPYIPTIPAAGIKGLDGQDMQADELQVGDIIEVSGNGIMLQSYPAQYPGITSMTLIERGQLQEAVDYADLAAAVFAKGDATGVPSGVLEYSTDLGAVSIALQPYRYQGFQDDNAQVSEEMFDGSFCDDTGIVNMGTPDARISSATDATATFDRSIQSVEVNREPLTTADDGRMVVQLMANQQFVESHIVDSGAVNFTMEPGYVYNLTVKFADSEASFALCVL